MPRPTNCLTIFRSPRVRFYSYQKTPTRFLNPALILPQKKNDPAQH